MRRSPTETIRFLTLAKQFACSERSACIGATAQFASLD
jgi:hypothetical protein